jgi:signal transduction histidine kinase
MFSLQRRLQVWLGIYITLLFLLLILISSHYLDKLLDDYAVDGLESDIEGILSAIVINQDGIQIRDLHFSHVYDQPLSGHYFVLRYGPGKELSSRSLWDFNLEFPDVSPGEARIKHVSGPANQNLLIWVRGFRKQNINFTLAVAEDHTDTHRQIRRYVRNFSIVSFIGLILLFLVQRLIVRKSLRSLDDVRDDLRLLAEGDRVSLSENVPAEVLPLVRETNHLLDLLTQRLERSRNSLGNLAHALKGPLSVVMQYFGNKTNMQDTVQFEQVGRQVTRIQELMDRELKRARLVGTGITSRRFNPRKEIPDLLGLLRQVHGGTCKRLSYDISPDIPVFGDREDMHELMGNLLDNACKWAKSRVTCKLYNDENQVHIVVEDDGKGLSSEQIELLMKRGVRLDESIEGHGLGLSIVKEIIKLYNGKIKFSRSGSLGGLKVHVIIPCKPDAVVT